MRVNADKDRESRSRAVAGKDSHTQGDKQASAGFTDNRPEAAAQRKWNEMANSRAQPLAQLMMNEGAAAATATGPKQQPPMNNPWSEAETKGIMAATRYINWIGAWIEWFKGECIRVGSTEMSDENKAEWTPELGFMDEIIAHADTTEQQKQSAVALKVELNGLLSGETQRGLLAGR